MSDTKPKYRWLVQGAAACMPNSCWGRYGRVGLIEVEAGHVGPVSMISIRARGVRRVVETWERLNRGTTERCAYWRAWDAATALAKAHNAGLA